MLRRIGCRFAALRREKLLSVQDMADAIGIPLYEVMKIERGDAGRYVSFDGYLRYAAYLGKTLKEVFLESAVQGRDAASALHGTLSTEAGGRQSLHGEHESIMLEHVQELIRSILACGEKAGVMTIKRHMQRMHMPFQLLRQYASTNAIVEQLIIDAQNERMGRRQQRENDLVAKVESVLATWHMSERVITQREIGDALGMSLTQLYSYPRVRAIVQQYPSHQLRTRTQPHEGHLVEQVHAAIAQLRSSGQFVCQQAISRLVGLPVYTLKKYPQVDSILGPFRREYRLRRKKVQSDGHQIILNQNAELEESRA